MKSFGEFMTFATAVVFLFCGFNHMQEQTCITYFGISCILFSLSRLEGR